MGRAGFVLVAFVIPCVLIFRFPLHTAHGVPRGLVAYPSFGFRTPAAAVDLMRASTAASVCYSS